ncbi:(d)CMP kinase [Phycicoccus sp. BSK3Z-2]|uniref:(D)CMP kinase n=1 Tax=Phycicoccus avicenniae TaxID=2828860 RepID=A0A941HYS2_9MICO|nr:(d)CMP kinase [Phycicoccus avicenniae]MBR7742160.1 (d)CMP kinase [Phycicoccus avicenniae]
MWFQVTDPADPAHVVAVLEALQDARPRCGATAVVAVDGPSGSGKTTLAKGLVDALGCPAVHMDEIYPGWDGLADAVPLLVDQVLAPLSRGLPGRYRTWDWEDHRWGPSRDVPVTPLLVVEGCASSVGAAGGYAAVRVWVEADRDERMRRGLARDGETFRPHWERWAAQEAALFGADGTRERADVVLDTRVAR